MSVTFHMSHFICHVSRLSCHMSQIEIGKLPGLSVKGLLSTGHNLFSVINRPGVAGAVLQTVLSLID